MSNTSPKVITDHTISTKIPVGILGATGSVGQMFINLLIDHPWFEIKALAASERSSGKKYREACTWRIPRHLPEHIAEMEVSPCLPNMDCEIVFSGLDSAVAGEIEEAFAERGYTVISNAKNHRMDPTVPLLVPDINASHLKLIEKQDRKGTIITNPNCCTVGLVMALKPLDDAFGLEAVNVVTMQAISGAGYPGVPSLDVLDNVVPFISGEEEKIETEPLKILGALKDGQVVSKPLKISAHCNRVPVIDGHTECVSVVLKNKPTRDEVIEAFRSFTSDVQEYSLPSAPSQVIRYYEEDAFPQPRLHREIDGGMGISIGRVREDAILDYRFTLLVHNTIQGAAGCALMNAELFIKQRVKPSDRVCFQ